MEELILGEAMQLKELASIEAKAYEFWVKELERTLVIVGSELKGKLLQIIERSRGKLL